MLSTLERSQVTESVITHEHQRSFNPLASVRMLRYDMEQFGRVLPETREQVLDEELSYLSEGVDRAARTTFGLTRSLSGELQYFAKGWWRPYTGMLITGQQVAHNEAERDFRKQFLADKFDEDLRRGLQMQNLKPGQSMRWYSAYPEREELLYGSKFMESNGFMPHRKMGFIYLAECQEDGTLILTSQTVDRSDDKAFEQAMLAPGSLDEMVEAYDNVLKARDGEYYYAGRLGAEWDENAWVQIRAQQDLVEYLLKGLESLAASETSLEQLEVPVKKHIYGVWAAFKKRIDGEVAQLLSSDIDIYTYRNPVELEVMQAYDEFVSLGRVLIGCGGSINILNGEANILNADPADIFKAIFQGETDKSSSLPSLIRCVNCNVKVPSSKVVKEKSWCCPNCSYEVDICNGKVICAGNK